MKKFLLGFFALIMSFGLCFAVACEGEEPSNSSPNSSPSSSSSSPVNEGKTGTLAQRLDDAVGETTLSISGTVEVSTSSNAAARLGTTASEKIVVDGGTNGATIKAIGSGDYAIRAYAGLLVFKNVTFVDNSMVNSTPNGWLNYGYLEFKSKLRFENCTFDCSVYLCEDSEAVFENCSFKSKNESLYGVWAAGKEATIKGCTFTGYRGLKTHEQGLFADVKTVVVDGCTFDNLESKPGLAIGTLNADTAVIIKNSTFINCWYWDKAGSEEGIDGFYEADTLTSTFDFQSINNTVDDVPTDYLEPEYKTEG